MCIVDGNPTRIINRDSYIMAEHPSFTLAGLRKPFRLSLETHH